LDSEPEPARQPPDDGDALRRKVVRPSIASSYSRVA